MSEQSLIYSNTNIVTSDAVVNIGGHTSSVYVYNKGASDISIKLNNFFTVLIPSDSTEYVGIDGDYTTVEVLTANSAIAFFALG